MLPPPAVRGIYRTDARARAAYAEAAGIYRIIPRAVCLPADLDDLRRLVCWAADHRTPLIPRGAGSAMGGGNVGDGVIVDLSRMAGRRLEIRESGCQAITSSAVTLAELNAAAGAHGLRLPPDPSSGKWATLGGMVSTNAAGARSVRYGSVRPWIEALTFITPDGEVARIRRRATDGNGKLAAALARFHHDVAPAIAAAAELIATRFPHTRKNSSGYALDAYLASGDALDLIIGAEGTLGFVTEIEWRLHPEPAHRAGLRVLLRSIEDLSEAVAALEPAQPSAIELLDRSFLDLIGSEALAEAGLEGFEAEALLLVELETEDAASLGRAVDLARSRVQGMALSVETAASAAGTDRLWTIRHAASPILARLPDNRRSLQVIEDACVPVARMSEYIRDLRRVAAERGIPVVVFGHAGDGHIHVNLLPDVGQPGWEEAVRGVLNEVTEAVVGLGGTLSGEHGDGRLRAQLLDRVFGSEIVGLFRRVKQSFDPLGIFNPGVILPSGDPPISHLKVGASAARLPPDVERSLREIERTGGYGRPRLELAGDAGSQP